MGNEFEKQGFIGEQRFLGVSKAQLRKDFQNSEAKEMASL